MNRTSLRRAFASLSLTAIAAFTALPPSAFAYISPHSSRLAQYQRVHGTSSRARASITSASAIQSSASAFAQEDQIVSVVTQAAPAVASVIISKDLPVLEQYYEQVPLDSNSNFQVRIPRTRQNGTENQVVGAGSAFFISSDGLLITNNHVVEDEQASYTVLTNDGSRLKADVVLRDAANDVALLRVQGGKFATLTLAASDDVHLAQIAIAIGNSLGEFRNTVSLGVVSGLRRSIQAGGLQGGGSETLSQIIQTDAAINEGNSGGPLLNSHGLVIGMNVALATGAQNIGFALPVSVLRQTLAKYRGQ